MLDTKMQKGDTKTLQRAIISATDLVKVEKQRLARNMKVQKCRLKQKTKEEPAIVQVEKGAGLNRSTYLSGEYDKRAGPHPNPTPNPNPNPHPNPNPNPNPNRNTLTLIRTSDIN